MSKKYFALVDCNNFFASCERVFRPDLRDKPVAVLSNNDGVIVARTQEVKDLGVPMAARYFEWKDVLEKGQVNLFSANFALYSDLSRRITHILDSEAPDIEVYSIDESFIALDMAPDLAESWARRMRAKILREVGVPVSIGIGTSKTLSKAASEYAKKTPASGGVQIIRSSADPMHKKILSWIGVGDLWGIGYQLTKKLNRAGVYSGYGLSQVSLKWAREQMTISGEKTVRELRGQSCYYLHELQQDPQKSILVSRSFADEVRNLSELEIAVASFAATLSHKLRKQNLLAREINAFASSSRFRGKYVSIGGGHRLDTPSSDSATITRAVIDILDANFRAGVGYKRAGVYSGELVGPDGRQMNLFSGVRVADLEAEVRRGEAIEELSDRYGSGVIRTATAIKPGAKQKTRWRSRADKRTPEYTTRWTDLAVVKV